ncbi:MAG: ClbS/DfsB family four-helix bundle protein [Pirellulaceae bacterium]|nr:ClbS/DfsB family four-helix bundle protein [Pirellulaceae bacterium]
MPKPNSKSQLLVANDEAFHTLNELLGSLSPTQLATEFPFAHRDRNVRDVLAHLFEWQQMMFVWYKVGMQDGVPEMPAPGFTWKTTPELNQQIWERCQATSLSNLRGKLKRSHIKLQKLIEAHSNEELFTKRRYPWTGSTSLGSYLTSAGWSHYHWALKLLRKFVKQFNR